MPPKRASSTKSTAAKSTPSKPARPATTAKAAASAGKGKAAAAKARAKPKPKPVTKLAPEYPSSTPRRSSRQGPKRTGSGEAVVPSKKAKLPPDQGDNRTGSVVDSLGAYNQAVGENPDGASEALDVLSVSDVIPDDILNQAMDDHDAKTEKHEPKAAVLQAAKSGVLKSTNQAMHGDEAKDKQDVPDFWATHTQKGAPFQEFAAVGTEVTQRFHGFCEVGGKVTRVWAEPDGQQMHHARAVRRRRQRRPERQRGSWHPEAQGTAEKAASSCTRHAGSEEGQREGDAAALQRQCHCGSEHVPVPAEGASARHAGPPVSLDPGQRLLRVHGACARAADLGWCCVPAAAHLHRERAVHRHKNEYRIQTRCGGCSPGLNSVRPDRRIGAGRGSRHSTCNRGAALYGSSSESRSR